MPLPSNKLLLQNLAKQGTYLFHGSDNEAIKLFKPVQAYTTVGAKQKKDGRPAIHTTQLLDIAIFMAIFNAKNIPKDLDSMYSTNSTGNVKFTISKATMAQLKNSAAGYLYVFNKQDFKPKRTATGINPFEWTRHETILPLKKFRVSAQDLPENIRIKSSK